MNNSSNSPAILRLLITYALIVPVAIFLGYLLTNPLDYSTFGFVGVMLVVVVFPLLLRWHFWLLLFSVNASIVIFFLKGSPNLWIVTVVLSLGISILDRALSPEKRFISVPQITWPLTCLIAVIVFTAKLNGGFGLRVLGSEVMGGKKYVFVVCAILSFFAFTARRLTPRQAKWAVMVFFLSGLTWYIGDLYGRAPSGFNYIFWIFAPTANNLSLGEVYRLGGVAMASSAVVYFLLARYGIRGIFLSRRLWRPVAFILFFALSLYGGYRGRLVGLGLTFWLVFFLEGMHRTKLLPIFGVLGLLAMVALIPLTPKLPVTIQRTLSFLPLPVSEAVRFDAESSSEWHYDMWQSVWREQVPKHLLLGKGYAITAEDFLLMGVDTAFRTFDASQQGLALSADFHNGWLSVLIPFGIWGLMAFVWFLAAGIWVLYNNYRHGDPALKLVNTFLLALFLSTVVMFFGESLSSDMVLFASLVGFSVSLNGGVSRPIPGPVPRPDPFRLPRGLMRPGPAFQR
ncbi:MAG TPA: hypothetical protein VMB80_04085 [Candidatus Acidoferrum sp.]|nr:hypothetical protein [Candidatus Acidoferrum sp.]